MNSSTMSDGQRELQPLRAVPADGHRNFPVALERAPAQHRHLGLRAGTKGRRMNVYLTFDVEVWCDGWSDLDGRFPASFDRYYFGRSKAGNYALPKTLEILNANRLVGVFFVEPLFAARFGKKHLDVVTRMIRDAGQDVQLHIHPEWTDEIRPPIIADISRKRQHLTHYSLDEQSTLIGFAKRLLEDSTGSPVTAFRAGSFAANRDTLAALRRNQILLDSSLNSAFDHTDSSIVGMQDFHSQSTIDGVECFPVTVIRDGFRRRRPAHVNACSSSEMHCALLDAVRASVRNFVIVSHNFEMLKPGSTEPDWIVVRRFESLCAFLAERADLFQVGRFAAGGSGSSAVQAIEARPCAPPWATARRHIEQLARRLT